MHAILRDTPVVILSCLVLLLSGTGVAADDSVIPPELEEIGPESIRESMIALVNLTTAPGLAGATFEVDTPSRDTDLVRGTLGYSATVTLRDSIADAYWGLALAYGDTEDDVQALDAEGRALSLDGERSILSFRASGGLELPVNQHFKIRPFLSVAASRLETETEIRALGENTALPIIRLENSVDALTTSGTVDFRYDRWYGSDRVEVSGQYTAAYTDTFNGSDDQLDTWGWNETLLLRAAYSWDSGYRSRGRPWRWRVYANHTRFLGLDKNALGFTYFTEVGLGLDHEWNIRPLDWFGLRFLGFKLGFIHGNDVRGISAGLSF